VAVFRKASLYFGCLALVVPIIPSNPILPIYQLHYAGFGAVVGHIGFDKIETSEQAAFDSDAYAHYLHHKYFEVRTRAFGQPVRHVARRLA
jgi:sterol desaturase/sphingolipid hydroxylase (fatty acid hydroxylase superfamily)